MNDIHSKFYVLGLGGEVAPAVSEINSLGLEDVQCVLLESDGSDLDKFDDACLALVLLTEYNERVADALAKLKETGVFTLVFSPSVIPVDTAYCVVSTDEMAKSVAAVVSILSEDKRFTRRIAIDLDDLKDTLAGMKRFHIFSESKIGTENRVQPFVDSVFKSLGDTKNKIQRALVVVSSPEQDKMSHPLLIKEMVPINAMIDSFPEGLELIWGVQYAPLPDDCVSLSMIVA